MRGKRITRRVWKEKAEKERRNASQSQELWGLNMAETSGTKEWSEKRKLLSKLRAKILAINEQSIRNITQAKRQLGLLLETHDPRLTKPMVKKFGNRKTRKVAELYYEGH